MLEADVDAATVEFESLPADADQTTRDHPSNSLRRRRQSLRELSLDHLARTTSEANSNIDCRDHGRDDAHDL